jgi:hypothetical protein
MSNFLDPHIQKKISTFVSSQFPSFYREEGDMFIQFMKAYYEWMESEESDAVIRKSRNLLDYRDIDATLDEYVSHFQNKYLYGMPLYFKGDKRFLVRHILDVYRSKGTIEGYKLLFKLLYNEEIEVYVPKNDILKASDGTWIQQKYIEVNSSIKSSLMEGGVIVGVVSGATAIAENYVVKNVNGRYAYVFYITNIIGTFVLSEALVPQTLVVNQVLQKPADLASYPVIVGSLADIEIEDGGNQFYVGDVLDTYSAQGRGARFLVKQVGPKPGVTFYLRDGGFGFTASAKKFISRLGNPKSGANASFVYDIFNAAGGALNQITYGSQLIAGFENTAINSTFYYMNNSFAANSASPISTAITYYTKEYGSIRSVTTINSGLAYGVDPTVQVRDLIDGAYLAGNISFSNSSATVTGNGTSFTTYFSGGNTYLKIINDRYIESAVEYRIVTSVTNNTSMTLDDYPTVQGNTYAAYKLALPLWTSSVPYPQYEDPNFTNILGQDEYIQAKVNIGNNVVAKVSVLDTGLSFGSGDLVQLIRGKALSSIVIRLAGTNYQNGDPLVIIGGGTSAPANGYINTNSSGAVTNTTIIATGSGYQTPPVIRIQTKTGTGADLLGVIGESTSNVITGRVTKNPIGYEEGYWSTTQGFLNSDKYIQDSYFYQDFSYAIKSGIPFDKYVDVIKKVFHISGMELFGLPYIVDNQTSTISESSISIANT